MKGKQIRKILNSSKPPLKILFKQQLFDITINKKPYGFVLQRDMYGNDAIVSSVYNDILRKQGLKMGCYVYKINKNIYCDGLNYKNILSIITKQYLPFTITFREFDVDFSSIEQGGKDDENRLHEIIHTMKNFTNRNLIFSSWENIIYNTNKQTMLNQSYNNNNQLMHESQCIERIQFILSYYIRWIHDKQNQLNTVYFDVFYVFDVFIVLCTIQSTHKLPKYM